MHKFLLSLFVSIFICSCTKTDDGPTVDQPDQVGRIKIENKSDFNSYYSSIDGIESKDLKGKLHDLIDNNKVLSYSNVWDALMKTDEDPKNSNNVILIYTGRSQAKSYKDNGHNGEDAWNREHVWAKSRGFGGYPDDVRGPSTDIHHIRPADRSVNTARYTKYFDNGGTPHSEATGCKYTSSTWEPRDEVKGDIARMMFYMAVRYEGDDGYADLELNDRISSNYSLPYIGMLSTLKEWHKQDPVDDFEKKRNQTIYSIQGNRNPFIDHPEFAGYIW
jgi:endonuclease I